MQPYPIYIGYDHAESRAFYTLCHSIWKRASRPVQIIPVMLSQLEHVHNRPREPLQSNAFSFSRFLVPYLNNYNGPALWLDCDMLVNTDITLLFDLYHSDYALQCVKHDHVPREKTKYLGNVQTQYEKKNWSSVMLMNTGKCKALTPEYVNTASGLDLHQFKWLDDDSLIGDLPYNWNYLVDYYDDGLPADLICILHYTTGGPWFSDYANCSFSNEWWEEYRDMINVRQVSTQHYGDIAEKIR